MIEQIFSANDAEALKAFEVNVERAKGYHWTMEASQIQVVGESS